DQMETNMPVRSFARHIERSGCDTASAWSDPRLADHAFGLELQIEELLAERRRLQHDGWTAGVSTVELRLAALRRELAQVTARTGAARFGTAVVRAERAAPATVRVGSAPVLAGASGSC